MLLLTTYNFAFFFLIIIISRLVNSGTVELESNTRLDGGEFRSRVPWDSIREKVFPLPPYSWNPPFFRTSPYRERFTPFHLFHFSLLHPPPLPPRPRPHRQSPDTLPSHFPTSFAVFPIFLFFLVSSPFLSYCLSFSDTSPLPLCFSRKPISGCFLFIIHLFYFYFLLLHKLLFLHFIRFILFLLLDIAHMVSYLCRYVCAKRLFLYQ